MMNQIIISTKEAKKATIDELLQKLSSSETGLYDSEAKARLQQYGANEISEKRVSPVVKILSYFWGPIPWMIEIAAILSVIIRRWEIIWIISALLLNVMVRFWQERKAENIIELLKQKLAPQARVLRNSKWMKLPALELVPGDIIRVRLGDIIPADIKLTDGDYLLADESTLTGESLPVEKHISDVAYSGSIVRQGEMNALVVATGKNSYFVETATLVKGVKTKSHFERAVIKIGYYQIVIAIALAVVILLATLFRHESVLEALPFALILTVTAIPVALPAVLSITMGVGTIALAKKEAIVNKLVAIEEMAGMDVLCSDKTGTITKNELTVAEVEPFTGFTANDVLLFGALASREEDRDPIDDAIIAKTKTLSAVYDAIGRYNALNFKPFDPISKRTEAAIEDADGNRFTVTKGAPQVILSLVANKKAISATVEQCVVAFAAKEYRTIGVAKTETQKNWQFVGLIPLYDPPREDSTETIKTARTMGVDIKMVTGDHTAIAREIAKQVHLGGNIIPPSSFLHKSDEEAQSIIERADGFAQVFPEDKYRIVELLQGKGHIVGMTGDGVNDIPALKRADAGIAVAGAMDAAKSTADIVLTNPGLSVIIDSIEESRKVFQRMNSYSIYRIGDTIRVLFFITLSISVFNFYPVTPIMLVLFALLNGGAILSIAYDRARYSDQPEAWDMRTLLSVATLLGLMGVISSFGFFYLAERIYHIDQMTIQSMMYLMLSVMGHFMIFLARTRGAFWSFRPANILLGAVLGTQLLATLIAVYGLFMVPIGWALAVSVWGYVLVAFLMTDFIKVRFYQLLDRMT